MDPRRSAGCSAGDGTTNIRCIRQRSTAAAIPASRSISRRAETGRDGLSRRDKRRDLTRVPIGSRCESDAASNDHSHDSADVQAPRPRRHVRPERSQPGPPREAAGGGGEHGDRIAIAAAGPTGGGGSQEPSTPATSTTASPTVTCRPVRSESTTTTAAPRSCWVSIGADEGT